VKKIVLFGMVCFCLLLLALSVAGKIVPQGDFDIKEVSGSPDMLPSDGDAWTENDNATYPWYNHPSYSEELSFTTSDVKAGSYALNITHTSSPSTTMVFLNCSPQDVKDYAIISFWMKVKNQTNWSPVYIRIWLTEDDTANWYDSPRYRITTQASPNTWFRCVAPVRAFLASNSPTWCQFNYIGIELGNYGSVDNTEILVDGLNFADDFEYYPTVNDIDYKLLPNWIAWTWYNSKIQTYGGTNYTSYYNFVQTDWTHDWETLETEVLAQFVYGLSYIYKLKSYDFVKSRLDDVVTWLLTFQYLNASSIGDGGFKSYYIGSNHLGSLKDTYQGWILAGLSVYYSIEPSSALKTVCDDLRGFLCDVLWDSTNKWFDISVEPPSYETVEQAVAWSTMPNGAIMAGLGAYQRYVSTNSTVESIVKQCWTTGYNKVKDHASGAYNRFALDSYEPMMYWYHGCYQNWKALNNATFGQEFLNLTNHVLANNMLVQNGSAFTVTKFTSEPYPDQRYFDGWGLACSLPLLMWIYDETANSHILDLVKQILYETFPERWGLMEFGGSSRFYGDDGVPNVQLWKDQMYVPGNAWIWWTSLRWLNTQSISQPYILSTTYYNGIIAYNYETRKMTFTVNGTTDSTSATKVYCGLRGEPMAIYSASGTLTWSYNVSTTILTLNVTHTESPARILIYWKFPSDINSDGNVDAEDLYILAVAYGSHVGDPTYNSDSDIDGDGDVDADDLYIFSGNYGKIAV